jgi:hypothetical protein
VEFCQKLVESGALDDAYFPCIWLILVCWLKGTTTTTNTHHFIFNFKIILLCF